MATLAAGHVITSAIFFDRRVAFGALFGIDRDPISGLGIVCALLEPFLGQSTWRRLVIWEGTPEAEAMRALALNGRDDPVEFTCLGAALNGVDTVGSGAPLETVFVVNICPHQELLISGHVSMGKWQKGNPRKVTSTGLLESTAD